MTVSEASSPQSIHGAAHAQDVIVVGFGVGKGIDLIRRLATSRPAKATLLLTDADSPVEYASALDAGGAGAISRKADLEDIVATIRTVGIGRAIDHPTRCSANSPTRAYA